MEHPILCPTALLGAEKTVVRKTDTVPALQSFHYTGRQTNKVDLGAASTIMT